MDRRRITALSKVTFTVVAWGASFIATKVALREISPITIVWLRFGMGVVILGAVVLARRQLVRVSAREWGYFALLGFLGITFHQWLQSNGLVTAQATTTAWIVATTPIFMALLGWLVLRERLGAGRVLGIALAAVGVLLVVSKGDLSALAVGRFGAPGDLLVLISAPNWAVFSVLSRRGLQQHPATRMMFYVMGLGWVFASVLFFAGPGVSEIGRLTRDGWLSVGFLGIVCSGVAYIFWYDALQSIPASQVGAFLYLEPLVAVIAAAVVLDEPLRLAALLGGAIILLGVWLVNRPAANAPLPATAPIAEAEG
jgi:drug/metabolite transporter (DMT)-like permease